MRTSAFDSLSDPAIGLSVWGTTSSNSRPLSARAVSSTSQYQLRLSFASSGKSWISKCSSDGLALTATNAVPSASIALTSWTRWVATFKIWRCSHSRSVLANSRLPWASHT